MLGQEMEDKSHLLRNAHFEEKAPLQWEMGSLS